MNVELYTYGLENKLDEAIRLLRGAIGTKVSKHEKDLRISEAVGIIGTVNHMVDISNPEEEEEECGMLT
jgi:hypothetical protein